MTSLDVIEEVRRRPFTPFRVFVSDGSVYDIRHPEQCMVGISSVVIGVSGQSGLMPYERLVRVGSDHITRIESIEAAALPGQSPP
jgi:hypothetical protein